MKIDDLPPPGDYWKLHAPQEFGDADSAAIFYAVGMTLSKWEVLEQHFAFLFQRFVEGSWAAKRAYGSIMSNSGRRDAISAAAEQYFVMDRPARGDLQSRLNRVLNHFKDAGSRRNELAHGVVTKVSIDNVDHGFFLVPPEYNSNKTLVVGSVLSNTPDKFSPMRWKYRYTNQDILELSVKIASLGNAVHEYSMHGWDWDLQFRGGAKPQ